MSPARRYLLAMAIVAALAAIVATSDDDPEGLGIGPAHLEQILELERQDHDRKEDQARHDAQKESDPQADR